MWKCTVLMYFFLNGSRYKKLEWLITLLAIRAQHWIVWNVNSMLSCFLVIAHLLWSRILKARQGVMMERSHQKYNQCFIWLYLEAGINAEYMIAGPQKAAAPREWELDNTQDWLSFFFSAGWGEVELSGFYSAWDLIGLFLICIGLKTSCWCSMPFQKQHFLFAYGQEDSAAAVTPGGI